MSSNLAGMVIDAAREHGDRPALKLDDAVVTYEQLDGATARVAGLLREKGMQRGDRVGIMLPNVPYFAIAYYGVLRAGGVVVPMNVLLKGREVAFYLTDPEAKLMFAWHGFAEAAREGAAEAGAEVIDVAPGAFEQLLVGADPVTEVAEPSEDDTAVILYTSGTTGTPKGAELTHGNLTRNCEVSVRTLFSGKPDDVLLGALPLFHPSARPAGSTRA
jgi:long-chain acyl-CoA synthetase